MQTIEDLQKIGFHGKNFVQVHLPSFFYDKENKKIIETQEDLDNCNESKLEPCVLTSLVLYNNLGQNMEMEMFRKIYNSKLVAWSPCDQPPMTLNGDQLVLLRFCICENV